MERSAAQHVHASRAGNIHAAIGNWQVARAWCSLPASQGTGGHKVQAFQCGAKQQTRWQSRAGRRPHGCLGARSAVQGGPACTTAATHVAAVVCSRRHREHYLHHRQQGCSAGTGQNVSDSMLGAASVQGTGAVPAGVPQARLSCKRRRPCLAACSYMNTALPKSFASPDRSKSALKLKVAAVAAIL